MIINNNIPMFAAWISTFETEETPMRAKNIVSDWYAKSGKIPYVIIDSDNNVVGIDEPSGGYPSSPSSIVDWKIWEKEAAVRYCMMFDRPNTQYKFSFPWKVITLYEALGIEE